MATFKEVPTGGYLHSIDEAPVCVYVYRVSEYHGGGWRALATLVTEPGDSPPEQAGGIFGFCNTWAPTRAAAVAIVTSMVLDELADAPKADPGRQNFLRTVRPMRLLTSMRRAFPASEFVLRWREATIEHDPEYNDPAGYCIRLEHPIQPIEIHTALPARDIYEMVRQQIRDFKNERAV